MIITVQICQLHDSYILGRAASIRPVRTLLVRQGFFIILSDAIISIVYSMLSTTDFYTGAEQDTEQSSKVNNIETKANECFDNTTLFYIEAKRINLQSKGNWFIPKLSNMEATNWFIATLDSIESKLTTVWFWFYFKTWKYRSYERNYFVISH
jgi:hypothetical protein